MLQFDLGEGLFQMMMAKRIFLATLVLMLLSCKQRMFNSGAQTQALTQQQFEQQFEVTRLTECSSGGELQLVWRIRKSDGSAVVPYVLGFGARATTIEGRAVQFRFMTAIDSPRPMTPAEPARRFDFANYRGFDLQIPDDEAAARWGFVKVDGSDVNFPSLDVGSLLLPTKSNSSASGRSYYFVSATRQSFAFDCEPLDSVALERLGTFGVRDGSHGFRGDRGVVVRPEFEPSNQSENKGYVAQWSCAGNRRKAIDHQLKPVSGGWLNQEEYCEWDRNGVAPERVSVATAKPSQLQCVVRSSFDQGRSYFLQQRLYQQPSQQGSENTQGALPAKSYYYDTKFNGYSFLVGGKEGYHVWDTRVWRKMGEKGDPRGAYITDTRKGIIGHCQEFSCSQPDEIGYTGNCVSGRQSDPLICNVVNSIYCTGPYSGDRCKRTLELNLTRRPVVHAQKDHIQKYGAVDPVLNPKLQLSSKALDSLSPVPVVREDVLFRADYIPPTRLGDTPIKLDLIVPDSLPECRHVVDPALLKNGTVTDADSFLVHDKTLVQCLFVPNERYNNCDEVASQIQVRLVFETQKLR